MPIMLTRKTPPFDFNPIIAEIKAMIEEPKCVYGKVRVRELVSTFNVDYFRLCKKFTSTTGNTIKSSILIRKVKEAKQLLEQTDLKVKDIAAQLHFASTSHFCNVFKRITKTPCSYWRPSKNE